MPDEAAPERKRPNETWESFAERKIREAQAEGAFDRLAGFGKPIPDIDEPYDENWWIKKKLRREGLQVLPPVLEMRLEAEKTLEAINELSGESEVRRRLKRLNERIHKAHYSHIRGPADGIAPVDIEAVVERWKERRDDRRK